MLMLACCAMVESSYAVRVQAKTAEVDTELTPTLRVQIEDMIIKHPGIYFRSAIRSTNRTVGVIQYHLTHLERDNTIFSYGTHNYKGYFPLKMKSLSDKEKTSLIMMQTPHKQTILTYLLHHGRVSQKELVEFTGLSDQNLSYHLKVLEQMGIVSKVRVGLGKAIALDPDIASFFHSTLV
jgi:predicted transcriptional regulator